MTFDAFKYLPSLKSRRKRNNLKIQQNWSRKKGVGQVKRQDAARSTKALGENIYFSLPYTGCLYFSMQVHVQTLSRYSIEKMMTEMYSKTLKKV